MNIVILGTNGIDLEWLQLISNSTVCIIEEQQPNEDLEKLESVHRLLYELVNNHNVDLRIIENHPLDPKVIYTVQQVCNPIDRLEINTNFPENQLEVIHQYYSEILRK
jgi:hypothetical protein